MAEAVCQQLHPQGSQPPRFNRLLKIQNGALLRWNVINTGNLPTSYHSIWQV